MIPLKINPRSTDYKAHDEDQLQFFQQIKSIGVPILTIKKVHYLLGNHENGNTCLCEANNLQREGHQCQQMWLYIKNFIARLQHLNVLLSCSLFVQDSFSLKETTPP